MKQIVDKLNKIAKKIDESVEIPQTDLIIDSLDAITKAYGGTPNDSNLIVDKLEDIYNNIGSGGGGGGDIKACRITFANESNTAIEIGSILAGFPLIDNILSLSDFGATEVIDANTTVTFPFLYGTQIPDGDAFIRALIEGYTPTNLTNCTVTDIEGQSYLVPTDTDENSSCTFTFDGEVQ